MLHMTHIRSQNLQQSLLSSRGSVSLEQLLLFSGAIAFASVALPDVYSRFNNYIQRFSDDRSYESFDIGLRPDNPSQLT